MRQNERLRRALSDLFTEQIITRCVTLTDAKSALVYEDEQGVSQLKLFAAPTEALGFALKNPAQTQLCFLSFDNCVLGSQDGKKCDCIIFDDTYLCFVELKLNVRSRRKAASRLEEAREQLSETITLFKNNLSEYLSDYQLARNTSKNGC